MDSGPVSASAGYIPIHHRVQTLQLADDHPHKFSLSAQRALSKVEQVQSAYERWADKH